MPADIITKFLEASTAERLEMARHISSAEALKAYFGEKGFEDYRKIAAKLDEAHLGIQSAKNLIFVPGIMGLSLIHI